MREKERERGQNDGVGERETIFFVFLRSSLRYLKQFVKCTE